MASHVIPGVYVKSSPSTKTNDVNQASANEARGFPVSLVAVPRDTTLSPGDTIQLSSIGIYADGSSSSYSITTWSSSDESVATVSSTGLVTLVGAGTAYITSTSGTISSSVTVTSGGVVLQSVAVVVDTPLPWEYGGQIVVRVYAHYSDSSVVNVTDQVDLVSSHPEFVPVMGPWGTGTDESGAYRQCWLADSGTSTLSAIFDSIEGTLDVAVTAGSADPGDIASIVIVPSPGTVATGGTLALTATATLRDLSTLDNTANGGWGTSNPAVATVSNFTGEVTGISPGVAIIGQDATYGTPGLTTITVT